MHWHVDVICQSLHLRFYWRVLLKSFRRKKRSSTKTWVRSIDAEILSTNQDAVKISLKSPNVLFYFFKMLTDDQKLIRDFISLV